MSTIKYIYNTTNSDSTTSVSTVENIDVVSSLQELETKKSLIETQQKILLQEGLSSKDPETLFKAQSFLNNIIHREGGDKKSLLINPNRYDDSQGYKRKRFQLNDKVLRQMSKTPIIRAIITTRQSQVAAFSSPQSNKYDTGFIVRRKKKYYTDEEVEITEEDKKKIQEITEFILNGGTIDNKWHGDSFDSFLKKIVEDSFTVDKACFECVSNRGGDLVEYLVVDGATIFLADSFDDDREDRDFSHKKEIKGYLPSYVQVIEETIVAEYYPWELCFGIRNESTDIDQNGYGNSEIEQLIKIITWMLYSDTYNGKFFSQGSSPKGLLKVGSGVNRNRLNEFRQSWQAMVAGVDNAWKIPVIENESVEWVDLQKNNTDMQFAQWQEYLIKVACAIFKIAPEEVGFNLGNAGSSSPLFEGNNEARLKYSRDKGLKPLLKSIQSWINKYIISRLDNEFEFIFVGLDVDSEEKEIELDIKKGGAFMGYKELRRKHNLPEELEDGDVILNPQFVQVWSQKQQENMFNSQGGVGEEFDTEDPELDDSWFTNSNSEDSEEDNFIKGSMNNLPNDLKDNPMIVDALKMLLK